MTRTTMTDRTSRETKMRLFSLVRVAVLGALLSGASVARAAPDSVATIKALVEQGQFERAYDHALAAEARYEGDPEFDFYFGLAAIEVGRYPDAIFAFERVVFAQPDQLRVRLELARAHFLAGNYPAAQVEFQRVLDTNPPAGVRSNIERFLRQIQIAQRSQQRELGGWIDTRLGMDSNINSATDADNISTPLGNFTLVEDGQEQEDEFIRLEAGFGWREPTSKNGMLDLAVRWQQKDNFSSDTFDLGIGTFELGHTRKLENGRVRFGTRVQTVRLENKRFQEGYGLTASYDRSLPNDWILSLSSAATMLRFENDAGRDVDQLLSSATVLRPFGKFVHSLSLYGAAENAQSDAGDFNARDFLGVIYGLTYDANDKQPFLRVGYQVAEFGGDHPVFARIRDDDTFTATAGLQWSLADDFLFTGQVNYTDVESNIQVFEYDRLLVELGLRRNF